MKNVENAGIFIFTNIFNYTWMKNDKHQVSLAQTYFIFILRIQMTLEQHGFELCGSTYTLFFPTIQ